MWHGPHPCYWKDPLLWCKRQVLLEQEEQVFSPYYCKDLSSCGMLCSRGFKGADVLCSSINAFTPLLLRGRSLPSLGLIELWHCCPVFGGQKCWFPIFCLYPKVYSRICFLSSVFGYVVYVKELFSSKLSTHSREGGWILAGC